MNLFRPMDELQRHYKSTVNPVQFFEPKEKQEIDSQNPFNFISQTDSAKKYHLLHPDVSYSDKGGKLDLMG